MAIKLDLLEVENIYNKDGEQTINLTGDQGIVVPGVTTIGTGTTGSPYDATTFLHIKGTTRSIIQQSSTTDAYYMFGDAAANNVGWVGYNHSTGTLDLHAETAISLDKNTVVTGTFNAKGNIEVKDSDGNTTLSHGRLNSNGNEGYLTVSNGSNWGLIARGPANEPRIGAWYGGVLKIEGMHSNDGQPGSNSIDFAQFHFGNNHFQMNAATSTFAGDVKLENGKKLSVGTNGYGKFFNDGNHTFIENYAGEINFRQFTADGAMIFHADNSTGGGNITEYFRVDGENSRVKFSVDTLHLDNKKASFGNSLDLQIYHDGTNNYIDSSTGHLYIRNTAQDKDIVIQGNDGGSTVTALEFDMSAGAAATFAGPGTFNTTLKVNAPDEGGAPAMTAELDMHGYEGRGVGIKMRDSQNSASSASSREWFVGTGYGQSGFNIGYAADGSQSSYSAQAKFQIGTNGNASFHGGLNQHGASNIVSLTDGSNLRGSNHLFIQGDASYVHIRSTNNSIYIDGTTHLFRNNNASATYLTLNSTSATFAGSVYADGGILVGQTSAYSPTGGGDTLATFTGSGNDRQDIVVSNQTNHASAAASLVLATHGHDFIIKGSSSAGGSILTLGFNTEHFLSLTSSSATFLGDVTATGNYTAGNSKIIYKAQRSGGAVAGDWSYDDATTDMSLGTSTAHSFSLKTGNTRALTINSSQNATFAGRITAPTQTLTSSDSTLLTLNPTANNYGGILFQYGGSNKGFSVYNSGSMVYGGESGVGTILQVNGQHALSIDTSKNATFAGSISVGGHAVDDILVAGDTFANDDDHLMTAAAIEDKILSYGYGTGGGSGNGDMLLGTAQDITADKEYQDNIQAKFGADADMAIKHDGTNAHMTNTTGDLNITTNTGNMYISNNANNGDIVLYGDNGSNTAAYLTVDGSDQVVRVHKPLMITEYITHIGDSNTYFGFSAADTFVVHAGATGHAELTIDSTSATFAGDLQVDGGDMTIVKQNGSPTINMLRDSNDPGSGTLLHYLNFQVDYGGSHQDWGGIEHRTTTSATRTKLNFNVKSTSGSVLNALSLDGTTDGTTATFAGDVTLSSTAPTFYLDNTTSSTGKNWRLSSAANGKMYIAEHGVVDAITLEHTTGNATFAGTVTTGGDLTIGGTGGIFIPEYIYHTGDGNTYFGFPSNNDTIVFATNGSTALTLDAANGATFTGKVSVGGGDTSTAQVALKGQQSLLSFVRGTSGDAQFFMSSDSSRLYFTHTDITSGNQILTLNSDESATFASNITTGGHIYLPGSKYIYSNNKGLIGATASQTEIYGISNIISFYAEGGGSKYMTINGGNVAIGTNNPTSLSANTTSLSIDSTRTDLSGGIFLKANGTVQSQIYWGTSGLILEQLSDDADIVFKSDNGSGGTMDYLKLDGSIASLVAGVDLLMALDGDGGKLKFGASQDLQIYHDGTDSKITNNTGDLKIVNLADDKDILFQSDNGSGGDATYFRLDGSVVETRFHKSTRHYDNVGAYFGDSADLQIYHDGSNSFIVDYGTGDMLNYYSNDWKLIKLGSGELSIWATTDAGVKLYYDNSLKLETTAYGVKTSYAATSSTDGDAAGDIVYFSETSTTAGRIYYYTSAGAWELADADAQSSASGMLAVALGSSSSTHGMLLRGMVTLNHDPGAVGDTLFLSTAIGQATATAPSGAGDIVRVIGYCLHASTGQIYFNPDGAFVEVTAG